MTLLAEDWGTEVRTCDGMRTTWARLHIKTPNESDVAAHDQTRKWTGGDAERLTGRRAAHWAGYYSSIRNSQYSHPKIE